MEPPRNKLEYEPRLRADNVILWRDFAWIGAIAWIGAMWLVMLAVVALIHSAFCLLRRY